MADARFEVLLRRVLPAARQMLCQGGEFYPFAATYSSARGVDMLGSRRPKGEPATTHVRELVESALRGLASENLISACAVCTNVEFSFDGDSHPVDAVLIHMEVDEGSAVEVYVPYSHDSYGEYRWSPSHMLRTWPSIFSQDRTCV